MGSSVQEMFAVMIGYYSFSAWMYSLSMGSSAQEVFTVMIGYYSFSAWM